MAFSPFIPPPSSPNWNALIVNLQSEAGGLRCELRDGRSIVLPANWKEQVRIADQLHVSSGVTNLGRSAAFYLARRQGPDLCRIPVFGGGRADRKRTGVARVTLPVTTDYGVSRIVIQCSQVRDYFFAPERRQGWKAEASWFDLLGVSENSAPMMIRLSFQVRQMEARISGETSELTKLQRGFNILMNPELRDWYIQLRRDPDYPVPFPPYRGTLLASGQRSEDCFVVEDLHRFVPDYEHRTISIPLSKLECSDRGVLYRNARSRRFVRLDEGRLALPWTEEWNQWGHLVAGRIEVAADFLQERGGAVDRPWSVPRPSTLVVKKPADLEQNVQQARHLWHSFGPFADRVARLRARLETQPALMQEVERWCQEEGLPRDIEARQVNWQVDYIERFYQELAGRATATYLFRNEYLFILRSGYVVSEIPAFGHATYLFQPAHRDLFLQAYARTTRRRIRHEPRNTADTSLAYRGIMPHLHDPVAWAEMLRRHLDLSQPPSR